MVVTSIKMAIKCTERPLQISCFYDMISDGMAMAPTGLGAGRTQALNLKNHH